MCLNYPFPHEKRKKKGSKRKSEKKVNFKSRQVTNATVACRRCGSEPINSDFPLPRGSSSCHCLVFARGRVFVSNNVLHILRQPNHFRKSNKQKIHLMRRVKEHTAGGLPLVWHNHGHVNHTPGHGRHTILVRNESFFPICAAVRSLQPVAFLAWLKMCNKKKKGQNGHG